MARLTPIVFALLLFGAQHARAADAVRIVAAENFYGDVAQQIGGADVKVTSILSNPDQDPHLFEASPSVARDISGAQIVVYSGLDYDPWMDKLLIAARNPERRKIIVAALAGKKTGENPHVWYDTKIMRGYAKALTDELGKIDPAHESNYRSRLGKFQDSIDQIDARIAILYSQDAGTPVTATEPVFGYMFEAIGLDVHDKSFQLSVMNNTEPSASDVAAFETELKTHKVRMLVYNSQASDPIAERMEKLARASQITIVAVTETEPAGQTYQQWMMGALDAIHHALPK